VQASSGEDWLAVVAALCISDLLSLISRKTKGTVITHIIPAFTIGFSN